MAPPELSGLKIAGINVHPGKGKLRVVKRPSRFVVHAYTKAEILEQNQLAHASVIRVPKDLE
jgi:hypothetical protein